MNTRGWLGSLLWVVGFNLCVALIALDWGLGWAIAILCVRHILLGIPDVYTGWRRIIIGSRDASQMPAPSLKPWPNRKWAIETTVCTLLSIALIIWFNIPLGDLLFSK